MSNFMTRFKELRKSAELTQDELAAKLNVAKSTISMYETGKRQPDFEKLEEIADFFNVDMDYLLGRSNTKSLYAPICKPAPTASEQKASTLFRRLDSLDQGIIIGRMEVMLESEKYIKKEMAANTAS